MKLKRATERWPKLFGIITAKQTRNGFNARASDVRICFAAMIPNKREITVPILFYEDLGIFLKEPKLNERKIIDAY